MKSKVALVHGDDWMGMYVDGKLVAQNHSLSPADILEALNISYTDYGADNEWLDEKGTLPLNFSDIVMED